MADSIWEQIRGVFVRRSGIDPTRQPKPRTLVSKESPSQVRDRTNGILSRSSGRSTQEWYSDDLTMAIDRANAGDLQMACELFEACLTDPLIQGVMDTFTSGVSRLPRKFSGDPEIAQDLAAGFASKDADPRSLFNVICRPSDITKLVQDGRGMGYQVGEMVWIDGLDFPILKRLDPKLARQDPYTGLWTYRVYDTDLLIQPGDGRWFFNCPGGSSAPWQGGIWASVARAFILKQETLLNLAAWQRKHSAPLRAGTCPEGATDDQKWDYLEQLIELTADNSEAVLPPGWDVKLVESNGQGYQAYKATVEMCNADLILALAGQSMTVDGGEGFSNSATGLTVRQDVITPHADSFSAAFSDQVLPYVVAKRYNSITRTVILQLDTSPPKDKTAEAQAQITAANVITAQVAAYQAALEAGLPADPPDIQELQRSFGVPTKPAPTTPALPTGVQLKVLPDVGAAE